MASAYLVLSEYHSLSYCFILLTDEQRKLYTVNRNLKNNVLLDYFNHSWLAGCIKIIGGNTGSIK